ncbi:Homeobox-like domain superfamily [Arabidopsis thaliana x Arabidopsis arenosa]|uniref:Homeobox-like domain superfamily n=1 Tax=Arabidopsis thaliana x Arabidopsis arenosa TaxID=1240361 RepID=A0A8T2CHG3_9BRAS|nr:Homeobox-like domain superfamily [Arabidopsis thaliana x Arabidopsis arenosa]
MGSLGDELSLGSIFGRGVSMNVVAVEKVDEHVKKLEEEKRKIESCKLELPLSLQILNDAILYLKDKRCLEMETQPLLKDFISLNREEGVMELVKRDELMREKKFQQWKANDDHISNTSKIKSKFEIERNEEKSSMLLIPKVETGLGLGLGLGSIRRKGIVASCGGFTSNSKPQPPPPAVPQQPAFLQQQALRKQRRCWNPELHRRFLDALQQLGGPGVATPKQIREHMQEEGLTNDEVKSHLQKYRLHIRKPNPNAEKQSAVVLGFNLWNSSSQEEEKIGEGGESSKRSNSQSDSPQGPLQLPSTTTTTGGDSSMEDVEDAKSESIQMERLRSP